MFSKTPATALEQEIGNYGTAESERDRDLTEEEYENTFYDDPGHISRAELRFRKALRAAGGLSIAHVAHPKAYYETDMDDAPLPSRYARGKANSGKQTLSQWTAIPDDSADSSAVNIVINTPKKHSKQTKSRLGLSTLAARQDLESYFNSLDHKIHVQEKKHASEEIQRLSGDGSEATSSGRQSGGARKSKGTSMMRLLEKAMESNQFRRDVDNLKQELHVSWHTE
mmetsp:Transcript_44296/g.118173  ORF Transcript_44296/g.118173 Transcript_44296/m.118173 type:complete len:226 (-) Transcript_44296:240-917(-)